MHREAIYEAWVPEQGVWSLWARPVLFGQMAAPKSTGSTSPTAIQWAWGVFGPLLDAAARDPEPPWRNIAVDWVPPPTGNAVLVLDLPGEEAVHLGLALASCGYRPVPLYNGCTGPSELIDHGPVLRALGTGAAYLAALALPASAPPAFLLDSRRCSLPRLLRPGMLDNRWRVFPEDVPSEQLLQQRGVSRVVLVQRGRHEPQEDLARVLRKWQEAPLTLETKDLAEPGPPRRLIVPPIAWYRRWWDGLLSLCGLQRSPRDGFGYIVPTATHG
jgi:hypothetical protein